MIERKKKKSTLQSGIDKRINVLSRMLDRPMSKKELDSIPEELQWHWEGWEKITRQAGRTLLPRYTDIHNILYDWMRSGVTIRWNDKRYTLMFCMMYSEKGVKDVRIIWKDTNSANYVWSTLESINILSQINAGDPDLFRIFRRDPYKMSKDPGDGYALRGGNSTRPRTTPSLNDIPSWGQPYASVTATGREALTDAERSLDEIFNEENITSFDDLADPAESATVIPRMNVEVTDGLLGTETQQTAINEVHADLRRTHAGVLASRYTTNPLAHPEPYREPDWAWPEGLSEHRQNNPRNIMENAGEAATPPTVATQATPPENQNNILGNDDFLATLNYYNPGRTPTPPEPAQPMIADTFFYDAGRTPSPVPVPVQPIINDSLHYMADRYISEYNRRNDQAVRIPPAIVAPATELRVVDPTPVPPQDEIPGGMTDTFLAYIRRIRERNRH
jgi:hypothetical protein